MPSDLNIEDAMTVAEFRAALRKFLRRSELIADGCGLTPQRYLLLLMIKGARNGSGRSTVTELAERLQLAQSTVTELVARSVDAGLIAREGSSSDGRVTFLQLTPEGERRLACSFTGLSTERTALYEAIGGLRPASTS
jgi:DNA-binding MarR family transcriptional regulator